ncbi:GNAT family N-acetyltransferase [Prosthecobacter sp. SYSU 5D2]|uniref:GNAT family N-acetyltransferase n=1 Tax=Prosthecobacter sp. SYSU 5D2 TaxID=3134134 RepID=UPI0031FF37E2
MTPELPVAIRHYRPEDLELLRQITVDSFGAVALDQMLEDRLGIWNERDWKARKADNINDDCTANPDGCFVAERGGEILGYITTRVDRINSIGRIPNLAVVEAARGLGLGRRLIHHAMDYFRDQNMKVAKIETMASNVIGQNLYPSCGFEEIGRQVHFAMLL